MQDRLIENLGFDWAHEPKNYTGAASTDKWFSLKRFQDLWWFIITGSWAGGTPAVTLAQATVLAGTDTKALAYGDAFYWTKVNTAGTAWTRTAIVSDTWNLSATGNSIYAVHATADSLDVANNFVYATLKIASPGANADFYGVIVIGSHPTFAQALVPSLTV